MPFARTLSKLCGVFFGFVCLFVFFYKIQFSLRYQYDLKMLVLINVVLLSAARHMKQKINALLCYGRKRWTERLVDISTQLKRRKARLKTVCQRARLQVKKCLTTVYLISAITMTTQLKGRRVCARASVVSLIFAEAWE